MNKHSKKLHQMNAQSNSARSMFKMYGETRKRNEEKEKAQIDPCMAYIARALNIVSKTITLIALTFVLAR
jgi:hypothetical protein